MSDLIDTTEMYLRTIFELQEEGIPPLRARIAERLHQSGPTVSQTVARMERDGLLHVLPDRQIKLSPEGHGLALKVMRKHRLAERLLIDVIGLDWDLVHDEACRWEHVISDEVEKRLMTVLERPVASPYGNPIPGLDEIGGPEVEDFRAGTSPLPDLLDKVPVRVVIRRISENLQAEADMLTTLKGSGVLPGVVVTAEAGGLGVRLVPDEGPGCELALDAAQHLYAVAAD
ncbi:metal-dependent transcriptional regulator [Mariniluteicoccus endophyticus]